jgi:hypothetical protein
MTLQERIRLVGDLIDLCISAPDLAASLTLVCPFSLPQTLTRDLVVPLSIVSGDRGKAADTIERALSDDAAPTRVIAGEAFFIAMPMHAAVATKPLV